MVSVLKNDVHSNQEKETSLDKEKLKWTSETNLTKMNKVLDTLNKIFHDSNANTSHLRILVVGMKNSGKTYFRKQLYSKNGDAKEGRFEEVDAKRNKTDGIMRTSLILEDRNSVDICFKRLSDEDYEWEEKNVKLHFVEPDFHLKDENEIKQFLKNIDSAAIFVDASNVRHEIEWEVPYKRYLNDYPPLVMVYNAKGSKFPKDKTSVRQQIGYESFISQIKYQILEVEIVNVTDIDNQDAIINALMRQATLKKVLELPLPNPRVVPEYKPGE